MGMIGMAWEKLLTKISIKYIDFVYKTSKVVKKGEYALLQRDYNEKFVLGFWHGDSYCFFPVLKGSGIYIITTKNKRGNDIANILHYFGYSPIRVPDESVGGNFLFKIRQKINGEDGGNLALTLDGPLGPYHIPKDFPFFIALISKRRFVPVSIRVKRKIHLTNRWDKYTIPLPFNQIEVHFHEPMEVTKEGVGLLKEQIVGIMEN
jgi:lysophospholipid acyltransferase (LPLAT)-like uncharacterized protein